MNTLANLESVMFQPKALSRYLGSLNRNQMQHLDGEIFAKLYWRKRNPDWYKDESNKLFARLRWTKRLIKQRLKTGNVKPELTENGSVMERFNFPFGDSLDFSCRFLRHSGWEVIFQESGCNVFWANEDELKLCTYCEGDVVMMRAPDKTAFKRDRNSIASWYADNA